MINTNTSNPNVIIPTIDPGVGSADAYQLGLIQGNILIQEAIGGTDERDVYSFSVSQAGEYSFNLEGLSADVDLRIFDAQGNQIDFSLSEGNLDESIILELAQGEYFILVESYDGAATEYSLNISDGTPGTGELPPETGGTVETVIPTVDPGVTPDTAYDLGVIAGNLSIQESVGGNDAGDAYSFSVSQAGEYSFSLSGLGADVDLYILDAQGNQIDLSETDGIVDEAVTLELAQGDYFAFVQSYDGVATEYSLNISDGTPGTGDLPPGTGGTTETIIPTVDPGVTSDTAYDLGAITGNLSIQESVGGNDAGDAYSFSVSQAGEYSFSLSGLGADVDLYILDAQGNQIDLSETDGIVDEAVTLELAQGDYFAFVQSYDGVATEYNLNISDGTPGTPDLDRMPNPPENPEPPELSEDLDDTPDTATDFGTFTNGGNNIFTLADAVGGADEADFFQFTVTESQQFSAAIENLTADADLVLYNSSGEVVESSETDGIVNVESFTTTIDAGSYFLGVHSWDGIETNYILNIESSVGSTPLSLEADSGLDLAFDDATFV